MVNNEDNLLLNLDKLHTTDLGKDRIKRNLSLYVEDVVKWCREEIQKSNSCINRKGKNWYISVDNYRITVNAYSFTIITAHKIKH